MTTNDKDHIECALSDTDLFTPAFVQSDIESGTFEEVCDGIFLNWVFKNKRSREC